MGWIFQNSEQNVSMWKLHGIFRTSSQGIHIRSCRPIPLQAYFRQSLHTYCHIINIFNVDRLCSIPRVTASWYPRSFLVGGNCLWICSQKYLTTNPSLMWWRPLSWAFRARNNSFLLVVYMSHNPSNESWEIRNAKVLWGLRNQLIYLKVWYGERRETLSLSH